MRRFTLTLISFISLLLPATLAAAVPSDPETSPFQPLFEHSTDHPAISRAEFTSSFPYADLSAAHEKGLDPTTIPSIRSWTEHIRNLTGLDLTPHRPAALSVLNDDEEDRLVCETSNASPKVSDIIDMVYGIGMAIPRERCVQGNGVASRCTRVWRTGTAASAICGRKGAWTRCMDVADVAWDVAMRCARGGKAGGKFNAGDVYFPIYHS